ncbi:MAG TPA: ferritin family protein [Thermoanaerobaculia bacterium]|nr:ferritin family protein [Thermoanaerobaculia bacterium]
MTAVTSGTKLNDVFPLLLQYTLEAYKTFEKLAEKLPNPVSAAMFANFAQDERGHRDLLEIKYLSSGEQRVPLTLGADLRFIDILEENLSPREVADWLISRERTVERRLREAGATASESDRNLLDYIAGTKRAHIAYLEREQALLGRHADWFQREDAEDVLVHGTGA